MTTLQVIALCFSILADAAIAAIGYVVFEWILQERRAEQEEQKEDEEFRRMRAKAEAFDEMMKAQRTGDDPFALDDDYEEYQEGRNCSGTSRTNFN